MYKPNFLGNLEAYALQKKTQCKSKINGFHDFIMAPRALLQEVDGGDIREEQPKSPALAKDKVNRKVQMIKIFYSNFFPDYTAWFCHFFTSDWLIGMFGKYSHS